MSSFDHPLQNFLLEKDILLVTEGYCYATFLMQEWK